MALQKSLTERRWPAQIFTPISVADGIITISDTKYIKVKQVVTLHKAGFPDKQLEVKRVLNKTQIQLGPNTTGPFNRFENPTDYNGGTLTVEEQERNSMGSDIFFRAVYSEEPVVALRTILIDSYGYHIDSIEDSNGINRLAVDTVVDVTWPKIPNIYNIPIPAAGTEYTHTLPINTKRFTMKIRDGKALSQFSFVATQSGTNFITIPYGTCYSSGDIDITQPLAVYFQANKPNVVMEIVTWGYP